MEKIKYKYRAYRYRYLIDAAEINFIRKNLKKGDIAVDVGSHKGGYLYWMQKSVTKSGQVYAFEPQPKLYNYLQNISKLVAYPNVIIENKGLSAQLGSVDFYVPITKKGSSPGARIDLLEEENPHESINIDVVTLDDYFFKRQIIPNLIKIDVEGHEKQVLLGGLKLLKHHPPKLVIECENRHLKDETIFEVFQVLLELDYQGYFFEQQQLKPLSEFKLDIHQKIGKGRFWEDKNYINNFIFYKN